MEIEEIPIEVCNALEKQYNIENGVVDIWEIIYLELVHSQIDKSSSSEILAELKSILSRHGYKITKI